MAAVGFEPTRAGFGGQLPTSWRCGLDDGDRTCTGLGSLCGGAHISSATPSLSGDGGDRTPLLQVHGLPCFLLHHVSHFEGASGTCTHLLRLTKTMPRCLGLGTMKPEGRFELPWIRLQGGRSAYLSHTGMSIAYVVGCACQKPSLRGKALVEDCFRRPMMGMASTLARFSSVTASRCL